MKTGQRVAIGLAIDFSQVSPVLIKRDFFDCKAGFKKGFKMKKKYILILIMLLVSIALLSETLIVPSDEYPTIQAGVDAANDGDIVLVMDGTYSESIIIDNKNITLQSEGGADGCIIRCYFSWRAITVTNISGVTNITGFTIKEGTPYLGQYQSYGGGAIYVSFANNLTVRNCVFENNHATQYGGAIFVEVEMDYLESKVYLYYNKFYNNSVSGYSGNGHAIHYRGIDHIPEFNHHHGITMKYNIFKSNFNETYDGSVIYIGDDSSDNFRNNIHNNIIDDCYDGVDTNYYTGLSIQLKNNIFTNVDNYATPDYSYETNTEYCAFYNVGYTGDLGEGCIIDEDLLLCELENYEYRLLEGSPCIDAGDPDTDGDGTNWQNDPNDQDSDGTRKDIGRYPTTTDMKWSKGKKWNWISFPRLQRDDDDPVLAVGVLDNLIPLVELNLLDKNDFELVFDGSSWDPSTYEIQSSNCYKFYPQDIGYYHLPLPGSRLDADYEIELVAGQDNWIGYWIPQTQDIDEAFYDTEWNNRWDDIYSIKAENWTYLDMSSPRDEGEPRPSMEIRPLHYGKGYIVRVKESFTLEWHEPSGGTGSRNEDEYPEPEFYSFLYKPDYEVVDVMEIDENIEEIGVFENGICVGAVVVNEPAEQILVYSNEMNREDFELTFEVYYGRGRSVRISNYLVYDERNKKYHKGSIIGGNQEYSMIRLGKLIEPDEEDIPGKLILHQNYPNPFNPSGAGHGPNTQISYNIPNDETVKLEVYNLKGQLVKTLFTGNQTKGNYTVTWDGKDKDNNPVSSGVYFYRLETNNEIVNKRMVLLR